MNNSVKYPRTYHFPFSEGLQNDDKRMEDLTCFNGKRVAITVKMDGENTTIYRDGIHARSLSSAHHPSRSVVKALHSTIKNDIPVGWRICGENLYAKHSIHYTDLVSYFYVFNVWDEDNICLPLNDTLQFCENMGLTHVKVVAIMEIEENDLSKIEPYYDWIINSGHEGVVVRNVGQFHYSDFNSNVAKAVRKNHVQTDEHWMQQEVVPNLLIK